MERLEQPAVPVGRRGECALIGAFLDRAAADGAALLLRGEPGAGKTVLLDAAADAASAAKAWVLRAAGVKLEVDLTFSGLNQLLFPVYEEELHELSAMHRDALTVAVGVRNGPAPHWLLVSTATVAVLPQAAAPPSAWARQERSKPRHTACEAWSAPRSTASQRGHPRPAAAWAVAGRTGGDKRDHLQLGGTR